MGISALRARFTVNTFTRSPYLLRRSAYFLRKALMKSAGNEKPRCASWKSKGVVEYQISTQTFNSMVQR